MTCHTWNLFWDDYRVNSKAFAFLLIWTLVFVGFSRATSVVEKVPEGLCGRWSVVRYVRASGGASAAVDRRLVGAEVSYSDVEVKTAGKTVPAPQFEVKRLTAVDFYFQHRTEPREIWVQEPIVVVRVISAGRPVTSFGMLVVLKNADEILTTWDGNYYLLRRVAACDGRK